MHKTVASIKIILLTVIAMCYLNAPVFAQQNEVILIPYRVKDKWGYSDLRGNIIVQPAYDFTHIFEPSYAEDGVTNPLAVVVMGSRHGLINEKGVLVAPCEYDYIWHYMRQFHVEIGKNKGIVNSEGKLVIPPGPYKEIAILPYGYKAIDLKGQPIHFDKAGKRILQPVTDTGSKKAAEQLPYEERGYGMVVQMNGKMGYVFRRRINNGYVNDTLPAVYDSLYSPGWFPEICVAKKDGAWGAITIKGQVTIPFEYETVQLYAGFTSYNGSTAFRKNGKWGLVNVNTGSVDLPFVYDRLQSGAGTQGVFITTHLGKREGAVIYNVYSKKMSVIECRYIWIGDIVKYKERFFLLVENATNRSKGLVGEDGTEYFKD